MKDNYFIFIATKVEISAINKIVTKPLKDMEKGYSSTVLISEKDNVFKRKNSFSQTINNLYNFWNGLPFVLERICHLQITELSFFTILYSLLKRNTALLRYELRLLLGQGIPTSNLWGYVKFKYFNLYSFVFKINGKIRQQIFVDVRLLLLDNKISLLKT